ncbi:MAG TPA: glycosyltransferase [Ramlibacter sp.]|uniref:glycosyltransferase family protein n=1 Tax=Ramlibacter sp. TaxID=1917967 RepID=UPI002D7FFE34|nr:glycosyltransferase [Ramlibacter sp.]HET8745433.1 glycosyltransferase [Ramlibacter sp.]
MADSKLPTLLFYCQHSLGIGHLTRSFALARALRERFRVVFLNGGRLPQGVSVPAGVQCIHLPPLGMDDGHAVISRDDDFDVATARAERRRLIQEAVARTRPAVLLVELFPFGRKKFATEILPMIRAARRLGARVACSLRDILVDGRKDQQHHDDRACWLVNRYFDAVLVHSDAAFARLEDSFRPRRVLRTPVWHTGFVVPERRLDAQRARGEHVIVSAGGGIVGDGLFRAALDAHRRTGVPMQIVAGPFLPEPQWQALRHEAAGLAGITLLRHVPDLAAVMCTARASISQCGYNTALDLVVSEVPALVVPYATATENEQQQRAARLASLGALQWMEPHLLDGAALAAALPGLLRFRPRPAALALDGAERSATLLAQLAGTAVQPQRVEAELAWSTC